jgi:CPA1 family monovalent cation:H+ antiporter
MTLFNVISLLIVLAAAFSWLNHRFLRLPTAIGLMLIALIMSLGLLALGPLGHDATREVEAMLHSVHFDDTLLHGMRSFLLFAGALHVNLEGLARQRWVIAILATAGVLGATFLIGFGSWGVFRLIGLEVLVLSVRGEHLLAGLLAIPLVLLARLVSVGLPIGIMRRFRTFSPGAVTILTWGGIRGASRWPWPCPCLRGPTATCWSRSPTSLWSSPSWFRA